MRSALEDWVVFLFSLILFVTIYRFYDYIQLLRAGEAEQYWVRHVTIRQIKRCGKDMLNLAKLFALTLCLLITIVRFPHFLSEIPSHLHSLEALVDMAYKQVNFHPWKLLYRIIYFELGQFWSSLCDLFNFIFLWETYKVAVRTTFFLALTPGGCIYSLLILSGVTWFFLRLFQTS